MDTEAPASSHKAGAGIDHVVTVDVHTPALEGFFHVSLPFATNAAMEAPR